MDGEVMDISEHLRSGNYLPRPLKDFHAQKDVFKCVNEMAQRYANKHRATVPNQVDAMCYVIDDKAFVGAIGRVTKAGWTVQIQEEFGTFVLNVPGIDHYHCIDDRSFPIGATNWLNSLDLKYENT